MVKDNQMEYYRHCNHSYEERLSMHSEEKKKMVEKASMFIKDGKTYFFDVSTSIQFLAKAVDKEITVYTHSLDNLYILSDKEKVSLYSIGENFNRKNRFFYKNDKEDYFKGIEFDVAFLGATAITRDGIYYDDEEDAVIKREAAKKSKTVILLAEHEKYENISYYKGLDLKNIDIIIVDPIASNSFVDIIVSQNINIDPHSLIII
ncbi:DeoR family transcriptional regulator [Clostridium pasteurianum DSM 525 = ATCC 6013]|uniref:DeoR family transcriptional regulator n=1 Tax=Clostridium pasteurianum DSM 525 = ATCC 6013 TaxID=1262449 RepID=A0A0H3J8F6_CLOPA|nr:hypothetical protein [Clostridium pasteurianum]AJA47335.1 DeoR family transcriptional regulator [Clostridium pasteurianum DSM 525 = ATCC 6013]AJA51323.1 DeoR family transcriptional regulator [Clostridium pasteurianum DSM 525 = ATCC 6013]AOZ74670.1 hypothetical protein AQ983_05965 [Clostridium pasteurianum DSM 525 = ATCC 6013]AOZ78467.1 hypothetical protein AQ984_05955 [Clostridium pasteurianum]ELP58672.1 DeoR family transcriptional regulator [Clostridium pasteurianum DSM 525 = ATCC 6013]